MATKKAKEPDQPESATSLNFILKRMERLAGCAGFQTLSFSPMKTKTLLSASLMGSTVETTLPVKMVGLETSWNFEYGNVLTAVVGRKAEDVSMNDGTLKIKASRYAAEIVGSETNNVPRVEVFDDATVSFEVNSEFRSLMKDGLTAVRLQKSMAALPDITLHMSFRKKTVHLVSFDRSQMVSFMAENKTGQVFELTLPLPKAETLFKDGMGDFTFHAKDGVLSVVDGGFKMSTSLPPAEEAAGVPIERVLERAKAVRAQSLPRTVSFTRTDLTAFLDNARVLTKSSALLKFQVAGQKTRATISADGNSISATIASASKESFEFLLDVSYLQAILAKSKADITVEMDDDIFIFKTDRLIYTAVLSTTAEQTGSKAAGKSKASVEEED